MPQKLNSSISLLDTIFHTTTISSSKTRNSNLHLFVFFENKQLTPSSVLNILGEFFSRDLSWKDHITSLSKQASKRLGVLRRLQHFFTPPQLLALYRGVVRPCMEYASHIWGGFTHTAFLEKVESRAFCLINSPPLTNSLQSLSARRIVASFSLYYCYYN